MSFAKLILRPKQLLLELIMLCVALLYILPLVLIVSVSLSSESSISQSGYQFWPKEFSISAYRYLFENIQQILRSFMVSITVTTLGTLVSIFLMSLYAYAISRKDFAYRKIFSFYIFFTMLFNGGLVPTYLVMTKLLHLQDTIFSLIVPLAFNAFFVIVLRSFFQTIPISVIESGRMDGASEWRIFLSLVVPMAIPGIATIALFAGVGYWNDWFQALLYIRNPNLLPLQAFLAQIQQNIEFLARNSQIAAASSLVVRDLPQESARMAIVVLTTLPILLSYPFFQRYFISGLMVGSVKE